MYRSHRLPTNRVLQERIGHPPTRPVGRLPNEVRRFHARFSYHAGSWTSPRRVVAKVEWRPGELYPRVGFIVTNLARCAENVIAFSNKRGTCEHFIKEGKGAINWTRLSCRSFAANAARFQLHALADNLGNFLRTLATPEPIKDWTLTTLKEKLIKVGARVVTHARYVAFQMAAVAMSKNVFADILRMIAELRPPPVLSTGVKRFRVMKSSQRTGEARPDDGQPANAVWSPAGSVDRRPLSAPEAAQTRASDLPKHPSAANLTLEPQVIWRIPVYFYEDYLKAYDAKMRKSRGVYYTPPPIVNFIVRAVDDILKDSFNIREGLADSN